MTRQASAQLQDGIAVLGLDLDSRTRDQLARFAELLVRWGHVYNLTSIRDPAAVVRHHLLDCLALVHPLRRWADGRTLDTLDVGSGGGLPGIVIAIACPEMQVTCVDAVRKKVAFLTQVKGSLALDNVTALHSRVEDLSGTYDVVTARAFASLRQLVDSTAEVLAPKGIWIAMKGQLPEEEITELPSSVKTFHVEQLTIPHLDASRCLVWMRRAASNQG